MEGTQYMKIAVALIVLLPLAGFIITLLLGKRFFRTKAHVLPVALVTVTAVLSIYAFEWVFRHPDEAFVWNAFTWVAAGRFTVEWGFLVDPLTGIMLLVVGIIGMLVHYYSIGYMKDDPGYYRFFAYLNLFMFAMFVLILANNYLLLFLGWEGVGLCSYLLISFWFRKKTASQAGKKAFLVNRVGDFGFTLGMFLIFVTTGTLQFTGVFNEVEMISSGTLLWICLLLFTGAVGKSAQFPLHVWLPDAMEGPTPVSALIHAATMVNAGVYMVARSYPLFIEAHTAMLVVMIVGTFTAIYAAYIAITQNDIKKVIAYSTVSSLGFMFMALGAGAWAAGIFYLFAHGFFKGLLFLCSGSVIHAMGGEQDMRHMGGLRKKIPITFWTMLIGAIALIGVFPFAGFWAKDEILAGDFVGGYYVVWAVGIVTAFLTAVFAFRLIFMTFFGESPRLRGGAAPHPRVAQGDDHPAGAAGHPVGAARHGRRLAAGDRLDPYLPGAGLLRRRARGVRVVRHGRRAHGVLGGRRPAGRVRGLRALHPPHRAARPPRGAPAGGLQGVVQQDVHGPGLRGRAHPQHHRLRRLAVDVLRRQGHRRRRQRAGAPLGALRRAPAAVADRARAELRLLDLRRHARSGRGPRLGLGVVT